MVRVKEKILQHLKNWQNHENVESCNRKPFRDRVVSFEDFMSLILLENFVLAVNVH